MPVNSGMKLAQLPPRSPSMSASSPSLTPHDGNARFQSQPASLWHPLNIYYTLPSDHPLLIAARTYALSLSLSLTPALMPILTSGKATKKRQRLFQLLKNESGPGGFAFAMTIAIAGSTCLERLSAWVTSNQSLSTSDGQLSAHPETDRKSSTHLAGHSALRTFLTSLPPSLAAILIMHARRKSLEVSRANIPFTVPISRSFRTSSGRISVTLDLTLLLLIRSLDAVLQGEFIVRAETHSNGSATTSSSSSSKPSIHEIRVKVARMTDKLDALLFWAASSR